MGPKNITALGLPKPSRSKQLLQAVLKLFSRYGHPSFNTHPGDPLDARLQRGNRILTINSAL
jgi:hypothetical protein